MRWSRKGALSLAKVGEKIINNEWEAGGLKRLVIIN